VNSLHLALGPGSVTGSFLLKINRASTRTSPNDSLEKGITGRKRECGVKVMAGEPGRKVDPDYSDKLP
jgi:hypothetical protein